MVMPRTGADPTVVVVEAETIGAVCAESSVAPVFVISVPFASGLATRTVYCSEDVAEALSDARFQVTVPPDCVPPTVAETKVAFDGTGAVSTTLVAFMLPLFDALSA